MAPPSIVVRSRSEAEQLLLARRFLGVISIRDPGSPRARGLPLTDLLELEFEDALRPSLDCALPPTEQHVRQAIEFAAPLRESTGELLVHCEKGQSRSAAIAIALLASWLGPGEEAQAIRAGFAALSRPWANPLLIDLADAVLERSGALAAAFTQALAAGRGGALS